MKQNSGWTGEKCLPRVLKDACCKYVALHLPVSNLEAGSSGRSDQPGCGLTGIRNRYVQAEWIPCSVITSASGWQKALPLGKGELDPYKLRRVRKKRVNPRVSSTGYYPWSRECLHLVLPKGNHLALSLHLPFCLAMGAFRAVIWSSFTSSWGGCWVGRSERSSWTGQSPRCKLRHCGGVLATEPKPEEKAPRAAAMRWDCCWWLLHSSCLGSALAALRSMAMQKHWIGRAAAVVWCSEAFVLLPPWLSLCLWDGLVLHPWLQPS